MCLDFIGEQQINATIKLTMLIHLLLFLNYHSISFTINTILLVSLEKEAQEVRVQYMHSLSCTHLIQYSNVNNSTINSFTTVMYLIM